MKKLNNFLNFEIKGIEKINGGKSYQVSSSTSIITGLNEDFIEEVE